MKEYLLPNRFKKVGVILLIISMLFSLYIMFVDSEPVFFDIKTGEYYNNRNELKIQYENIANEIAGSLLIISLIFVAFSKDKHEDEFISKIRLESLVWAVYVNYGLLFIAFIFVYGFAFFDVMVFNMFTLLIFFIIRFNFYKYKLKKQLSYEE